MKAKFYLIAAAACAALAACSKNEVAPVDVDQEITFQAVVNKASTKALIDGVYYPTTAPSFGTAAFYNAGSNSFTGSSLLYIPESEVTYKSAEMGWRTDTPYYWPKNGSLTFFSYSPWEALNAKTEITATNGVVITNYNVDENPDIDVMVADVNTTSSNDHAYNPGVAGTYQNGVQTIFRHKLAQIVNITFKTDKNYKANPIAAGSKQFFINQVDIKGVKQQATYTSGNNVDGSNLGSWGTATGSNDYEYYKESTSNEKEFSNTAAELSGNQLIMPQTLSDTDVTKFVIKYTIRTYSSDSAFSDDVVTVEVPLYNALGTNHAFAMNKKYTFNFTIGLNQIYWAPEVVNWEEESFDYTPTI